MKKPKDNLFRLITSMSPAEKRYFKMHFSQPESLLAQLFDLLNGMETYDEAQVKQRLTNDGKNLKVHKVQLIELLLKSLTVFHSKKDVRSKLRQGLEEVDILMEKELYDIAADRLGKLKKLGQRYEEYTYLIEIAGREVRLSFIHYDQHGRAPRPFFEQMRVYIDNLVEQQEFGELNHRVLEARRRKEWSEFSDSEHSYFQELSRSEIFSKNRAPNSFRAQASRLATLGGIFEIIEDVQGSLECRLQTVALFDQHPEFAKHYPLEYLGSLRNLINHYIMHHEYATAQPYILQAQQFAQQARYSKEQLIFFYHAELHVAYCLGQFHTISTELEQRIITRLEQHSIATEKIAIVCYVYLAVNQIIKQDFGRALHYLRRLHEANEELQQYFDEIYTIVEFIAHFESKDHILLHNLIATKARRLGTSSDHISPFYFRLLQFFRKLNNKPFNASLIAQEFLLEMGKIKSDKVAAFFTYFRLDNWLKALAERRPFSEYMLKPNKKNA